MFMFYDTETTGLNLNFSQILQMALILTDDDLNIIASKKLESRCAPWTVPSPGALLITGFTADELKNKQLSAYEMMQEVDEWVRSQKGPLIFAGYNSIGYDEPLLAQNLYQNLLESDLTSSGQNARMDIMLLVKAVAHYMPGILKLDILTPAGNPSTTLINVASQNGVALSGDDAHDALNDIKATLGVAKLLRAAAPQIWDQLIKLSTTQGTTDFLDKHDVFTYTRNIYGKMKTIVATSLVERPGSTVQALYDLSFDPKPYLHMTVDQLKKILASKNSAPFVLIHKNDQPILMPMDMSDEVMPPKYSESIYVAHAKTLQDNKEFLSNLQQAAELEKQERDKSYPPTLPEHFIRQNIPDALRQWMDEFNASPQWQDAALLVENFENRFKTELAAQPGLSSLVDFASRIIYEHAPDVLTPARQAAVKKTLAERILNTDTDAEYITLAKAQSELKEIETDRAKGVKKWQHVTDQQISDLKNYYNTLETAPSAPAQHCQPRKKARLVHTSP